MADDSLFNFGPEEPIEEPIEQPGGSGSQETIIDNEDVIYENPDDENNNQFNYIDELLKAKGIDRNKIQIYNDQNELVETTFDELSDEEKYDLLSDTDEPVLPSDDEIETLNFLRANNMTLQQFAEWQRAQAVEEYLNQLPSNSNLDQYSDDEIIAYDLIQRFGDDMSDEEIDAEIDRLKENEEAYKKRVELLRSSYKSEEEAQAKLYEEQEKSKYESDQELFRNAYISSAQGIQDIQGITLDNNDREELLQYVLTKDAANRTEFAKAMDNPDNVLKMAWFLLHGEEAFNATVDYFKKEISKREKAPRVVTRQQQQSKYKDAFQF